MQLKIVEFQIFFDIAKKIGNGSFLLLPTINVFYRSENGGIGTKIRLKDQLGAEIFVLFLTISQLLFGPLT